MSQPLPNAEDRVEMSQNLRATLQRAGAYAVDQAHRFVTIEHILLALTEDPDAELMLKACSVEKNQLHADISAYIGMIEDRIGPDESAQPALDPEAARVVNSAVVAAQKSKRSEVNGAIVLAAIIGDGRSPGANVLRTQGLTFQAAIQALQAANAASSPAQSTEPSRTPVSPAATRMTRPAYVGRAEDLNDSDGMDDAADAADEAIGVAEAGHRPTAAEQGGLHQGRTSTEDVLADARRRIDATRDNTARVAAPAAPASARPEEAHHPDIEQPISNLRDRVRQSQMEETAKRADSVPQPLQTSDSLARFERRPPPPFHRDTTGGPPEGGQVPDPVAKSELAPTRFPSSPPQGRIAPASPPPPPPNPVTNSQGMDAFRRPPPPSSQPQVRPPPPVPPQGQPMPSRVPTARSAAPPPQMPGAPPRTPIPGASPPSRVSGAAPSSQMPGSAPTQQGGLRAAPPPQGQAGGPTRVAENIGQSPAMEVGRVRAAALDPGQLIENVPRKMRVDAAELVEVRIARADLLRLAEDVQRQDVAAHNGSVVTKAMSVRLRAPEGGCFVESASPETHWIENQTSVLSDDFASWRWTVTPKRSGRARLLLIVSARTVASDGLVAETAMPDQIFDVRVSANYRRSFSRLAGWTVAFILGGIIARFGEQAIVLGQSLFSGWLIG
ncbi:MAG: Clp protease N-terminal domain-containing protein [Hyphomicrobiaceae bacterium]